MSGMNRIVTYIMSVLFILAFSGIVGWFMIYEPYEKQKQELQEQIDSANNLVKKYRQAKTEIEALEVQINEVKQKVFRKLCSAQGRTIEQFLREVEIDGNEADIDMESIRIDSISSLDLWSKIPLDFNIAGPYFKIYDFLARVQKRGKMDFSNGVLSITAETKIDRLPNLMKLVDQQKTKYTAESRFPNLRVNLNGEIIIIDKNHLLKYRTDALSSCDGV